MLRAVYHQLARSTAWYRYSTPLSEFHSSPIIVAQNAMKVKIIPALDDNYMYLIIDEETKTAAAVDPVQPEKVIASACEDDLDIKMVLTTHHHWDHAGGNKDIASRIPNLLVYGGDDRIDALTNKIEQGSKFKIGNLSVKCLFTPCHTKGHICYYVTDKDENEAPAVFTGDTLFVAGCGKFFEGQPDQMYNALVKSLGSLPQNTKVYCGHEYTVNNLKYALHVEPENQHVIKMAKWAKEQREKNNPTVPSTIGNEMKYNPFMRVEEEGILKHSKAQSPVDAMGFLRSEKDRFKAKV